LKGKKRDKLQVEEGLQCRRKNERLSAWVERGKISALFFESDTVCWADNVVIPPERWGKGKVKSPERG